MAENDGGGGLLIRSHYRVCREYCSPEQTERMRIARNKQNAVELDLSCESVFMVRPLMDIILGYWALSGVETRDLKRVPSDILERYKVAKKVNIEVRCHPCVLTPKKPDPSGQWRCDAWRMVEGCKRNLSSFGISGKYPRWSCDKCDFDLCDLCTLYYRRNSATKQLRPQDAQGLTIGIFTIPAYRLARERPSPHVFSVPLLQQARQVYLFLEKTAPIKDLDNIQELGRIISNRYLRFIALLIKSNSTTPLIPALDVEVVWFTHMLQSDKYAVFAEKFAIPRVPHTWTLLISEERRQSFIAKTKELWTKEYPGTPYDMSARDTSAPFQFPKPEIWQGLVVNSTQIKLDRTWFAELGKATQGIDVKSSAFLHRSLLGYQRFLFLIAKYPKTLQRMGFAPSPPIDLFWHTHLLQPNAYAADSERLIFNLHHHRLLDNESQRTPQTYLDSSPENAIWKVEFGESYAAYIQRLPSKVTALHSCPMTFLVADGSDWRCDAWKTPRGCVRGLSEFGRAKGVDRWCCEKCDFDLCDKCFERGL